MDINKIKERNSMSIINSTEGLSFSDILVYPKIDIEENTFTFIRGKSGSGKSTYLKLLNRTALPSYGEIFYNEKNIKDYPVLDYRKEVLLVPQEVFLIEGTIYDNFKFYYESRDEEIISKEEMKKFLNLACLYKDITSNVDNLSGGERQRVFLAIFLSLKPKIVLLDEPTAALDISTSNELMKSLKNYFKENNITSVCVSHNDEIVYKYSEITIEFGGER